MKTLNNEDKKRTMKIAPNTQFSTVKAFVHWWLLAMVGLVPAMWIGGLFQDKATQTAFTLVGLVWAVVAVVIIGRRGERYTKRVLPTPAGAHANGVADQSIGSIEDGTWFGSFDEVAGYAVTYDD